MENTFTASGCRHQLITRMLIVAIFALGASACGSAHRSSSLRLASVDRGKPPFAGWWDSASPSGNSVVLPADVLFSVDSATLSPAGLEALRQLAGDLAGFSGQIAILGFTDDTGSPAHNLALSRRRADAVVATLVSMGMSESRMTAIGRGSSDPVAPNDTAAGRSDNRRVEIEYLAQSPGAEAGTR